MRDDDGDDEIIMAIREQSHRRIQTAFAFLAIFSVAAGLAVHQYAAELGLADADPDAVAASLLCMGACYVATMLVWDWLFGVRSLTDRDE